MVYNNYIEGSIKENIINIVNSVKAKIPFKLLFFIILSLLISSRGFIDEFIPFSYILFGIASVFEVPLISVLIPSIISLFIGDVSNLEIIKMVSFFVSFTFITSLLNIEGVSKKYSVFIKFILSYIIVDFIFYFINGNASLNIFSMLGNLLILSILYFVFVFGTNFVLNINKKYVYSDEESISFIIMIAIILATFSNIKIGNFSISNILLTATILIYGCKSNGILASCAGAISGMIYILMIDSNLTLPVSLAITGLLAGFLSKFGKLPVLLAFILGNIYISYYINDFSDINLRISEIVFSSVVLLFMPKNIEVKLKNLFDKNKTISKAYENVLDSATKVKTQVGTISKIFDELSQIDLERTKEDELETREVIKRYIKEYVENNCISCSRKNECLRDEKLDLMVDYICTKLENAQNIDEDMLLLNCDDKSKIISDIKEIYSSIKIMRILKKKEKEDELKLNMQYKEVSKVLSDISKQEENKIVATKLQEKIRAELKFYGYIVYEDEFKEEQNNIEYVFITDILTNIEKQKRQIISLISNIIGQSVSIKLILNSSKTEKSKIKVVTIPKYNTKVSIVSKTKDSEEVSGDSYLSMELQDLNQINVISDGAGSGINASKSSKAVINMLEKLLDGGFEHEKAIEIINSVLKLKSNDNKFSTLDISVINLKDAIAQFIKIGSAPTYILRNSKITTILDSNLPLGLVTKTDYIPIVKKLQKNDIIIQLSDGAINDKLNPNDNYITNYLQNLDITKSVYIISDELEKLIIKENKNLIKDDFTVIVTKIDENK